MTRAGHGDKKLLRFGTSRRDCNEADADGVSRRRKEIALRDYHLFQQGDVYVAGTLELGVESPLKMDFGPGIIAHNVLRVMGEGDGLVLSPRHPLSRELSLLND